MPKKKSKKRRKRRNLVRSLSLSNLLSRGELLRVADLEDIVLHVGDFPCLCLVAVDSPALEHAFKQLMEEKSPIGVKCHQLVEIEQVFNILRLSEKLDNNIFHVFPLYRIDHVLDPLKVASNLMFYRDYIPQYKLKIALICSHRLLETIAGKAYDFFSIASFKKYFTDFSRKVQQDLADNKQTGARKDYEKRLQDLEEYRQSNNVIDAVLLRKLFGTAASAQLIYEIDNALLLYDEAFHLAERLNEIEYQAQVYSSLGEIYKDKGDLEQALTFFHQALDVFQQIGHQQGVAQVLGRVGVVYFDRNELKQAFENFQQALEINRKIDHIDGVATELSHIGSFYQNGGNREEALKNHKEALNIFRTTGNQNSEAAQLVNIAMIYRIDGRYDVALKLLGEALSIYRETGNRKGLANVLGNIGFIYKNRGDIDEAIKYHNKALEISRAAGLRLSEANNQGNTNNISI